MGQDSPEDSNLRRIPERKRIDTDPKHSEHKGLLGLYESLLRRFKESIQILSLLPLYSIAGLCFGIAATPALALVWGCYQLTANFHFAVKIPILAITGGMSFFVFGFSLLLVLPALNRAMRLKLKPWRGPYFSLSSVTWFMHNGLTYLARFTFLEFVTPTPYSIWFYRAMGMKIGKGTQINSTCISDPSLIELGDKVTIGGSATIIGHYGVGGFLILAKTKIGSGATIGLKAIIMGGAEVGENARILPNSVVLPGMRIPAGETWGGIPAQKVEVKKAA